MNALRREPFVKFFSQCNETTKTHKESYSWIEFGEVSYPTNEWFHLNRYRRFNLICLKDTDPLSLSQYNLMKSKPGQERKEAADYPKLQNSNNLYTSIV